jgi:hypothetical protein
LDRTCVWQYIHLESIPIVPLFFEKDDLTHAVAAQTDGSDMLELAQNVLAAGLVAICSADFLYTAERDAPWR